jgi:predicted nucleotidyltransferase
MTEPLPPVPGNRNAPVSWTSTASLVEVAEVFSRHRVEYLVIGGQAAILHGAPLPTQDIDICYQRTSENLERLADALAEIRPALYGASPELPLVFDVPSLAMPTILKFHSEFGPIDLFAEVEPLGIYECLVGRAGGFELKGVPVPAIGLDDLIAVKSHTRRPTDHAAISQLERIKSLRDEKNRIGILNRPRGFLSSSSAAALLTLPLIVGGERFPALGG